MSGQLHTPAALPPGKVPRYPFDRLGGDGDLLIRTARVAVLVSEALKEKLMHSRYTSDLFLEYRLQISAVLTAGLTQCPFSPLSPGKCQKKKKAVLSRFPIAYKPLPTSRTVLHRTRQCIISVVTVLTVKVFIKTRVLSLSIKF
jgi:hypothetical protein